VTLAEVEIVKCAECGSNKVYQCESFNAGYGYGAAWIAKNVASRGCWIELMLAWCECPAFECAVAQNEENETLINLTQEVRSCEIEFGIASLGWKKQSEIRPTKRALAIPYWKSCSWKPRNQKPQINCLTSQANWCLSKAQQKSQV